MRENEYEKLCCRNPMHDSVSIVQESEMTLNKKGSDKQLIITERNVCRKNHDFKTTKKKEQVWFKNHIRDCG